MKVKSIRIFNGVNFYTHHPAVVGVLDYEDLPETNTQDITGFANRLFKKFPLLNDHVCGEEKGECFSKKVADGMELRHVIEHVAVELFNQLDTSREGRLQCGSPRTRHDRLVVETHSGEVMRHLIPHAVNIVDGLVNGRPLVLDHIVEAAREILNDLDLGPSGRTIVEAAERRGIPWTRENSGSLVRLGYGRNLHFIQAALTDMSSVIAVHIAGDKNATKERLKKFSIPTPSGYVAAKEDEAVDAVARMGSPVVVKPLDGNQGKGVSLNLTTENDVRVAFHQAQQFSQKVLIEELLEGNNYRVLMVGGKMVAASEREPCQVVGDEDKHTLKELIDLENQNPLRGDGNEKPLTRIKLTPNALAGLVKSGWTLDSVPAAGQVVEICAGMNLSTGGTAKDVTDDVHRSVELMCERAARAIGLDICGIDLVLKDITQSLPQERGGIVEINATPGLRMHVHPSRGKSRDVGAAIIEMLYPTGTSSRIPIIAVTGTNGKTTVTRMISHILGGTGRNVGTTTTDGILLNGENIVFGDTTGPASARTILSDTLVDIAVLETARGGIIRRGLGWDWADIAVITNITEDHIGQDGITSVKDLVEIKALIAERVREGGTVILNADDEESANLASRPTVASLKRNIVLFSTQQDNPSITKHIADAGTAYVLENNWLCEARDRTFEKLFDVTEIPATIHGTSEYQVQNVMATTAAARAMGMPAINIASAFRTFSGEKNNQGRTNIYRVNNGFVVIDYGHNPKAIESIGKMISKWGMRSTGIISFPGDRTNEVIEAASKATSKAFDRIIIKGDKGLRGRQEGEVAEIMMKIIASADDPPETTYEKEPYEVFNREISKLRANEVIVFFYEKLEPTKQILEKYNAVPTEDIYQTTGVPVVPHVQL